ncbi:MAG: hypothetical protein LBC76_09100 [Treponema sp.]|nr:hypothetical protein [Treponema sp.]
MKRRILTGLAVIVLAITMVMGCGGGGGGGGGEVSTPELDKNVNLFVSNNASDIKEFNSSRGYTVAKDVNEAKTITTAFFENGGLFSGLLSSTQQSPNILYSSSSASRAIQTEPFRQNFAEDEQYLKIRGYVDGTLKYEDDNKKPFYVALNGEAKARIEIEEGYNKNDYFVIGVVAGAVRANNITIREDMASGSVIYDINGAINIADTSSIPGKSVKCIFSTKSILNLGSGTVTVKVSIKAYGSGNKFLGEYDESTTQSLKDFI